MRETPAQRKTKLRSESIQKLSIKFKQANLPTSHLLNCTFLMIPNTEPNMMTVGCSKKTIHKLSHKLETYVILPCVLVVVELVGAVDGSFIKHLFCANLSSALTCLLTIEPIEWLVHVKKRVCRLPLRS